MKSAEQVALLIKIPTRKWEGQCYGIACAMVKAGLVEGKPRYGKYTGPIDENSFFKSRRGIGFCQHGWVELPDGKIVDPTRWVFEAVEPYIFYGEDEEGYYDLGGQELMKALRRPVPEFDPSGRKVDLQLTPGVQTFIQSLLGDVPHLTFSQVHWLSHLTLDEMGEHAKPLYQSIVDAGQGALIPIDLRRKVLGG